MFALLYPLKLSINSQFPSENRTIYQIFVSSLVVYILFVCHIQAIVTLLKEWLYAHYFHKRLSLQIQLLKKDKLHCMSIVNYQNYVDCRNSASARRNKQNHTEYLHPQGNQHTITRQEQKVGVRAIRKCQGRHDTDFLKFPPHISDI